MRRRSLPKGISRTPHGFRASIRIHTHLHQKHFRRDTPIDEIQDWLVRQKLIYRKSRKTTGRFKDDAETYLASVRAMPTYNQRVQHINEWIAAFGDVRRAEITSAMMSAQLHLWRTESRTITKRGGKTMTLVLSPAAVNKRRTALMHLYTTLDGRASPNPVKDTPRFMEPRPAPRGIPWADVRAIFRAMPASRSKAHLLVMAYTGIPENEIAKIVQADVDLTAGTVAVAGRSKGKGTPGRIAPLIPEAIRAFRLMAREDAYGPVSRTVLRRVWRRACAAAGKAAGSTPYDLRHSFGTEVYSRSGDIRATQLLMGHSTPQLTHRYTVAAEDPRVRAAVALFGRKG